MAPPPGQDFTTRRAVAVAAIALAVTALLWLLLVRDSDSIDQAPAPVLGGEVPGEVADLVSQLSVDQKAAGVIMAAYEGTDPGALADELAGNQLGGIVIGSDNWIDPTQGLSAVEALLERSKLGGVIPPVIAAAQEGGVYRALEGLPPDRRAIEIGDFADPQQALEWSREAGDALRTVGIRLNLGLIGDVATIDSPIADRAFSDDPATAAAMVAAAVRGCRQAEVACAVAHFPGNGATSLDTAEGPATVALGQAELEVRDLVAFRAASEQGVAAMVLSNSFYGGFDPVTPAGLSPEIATDLLRIEVGFQGVAITDDLSEPAVSGSFKPPEAAIAALAAGADLVQVGAAANLSQVRNAIVAAVNSGELSEARLDEAIGRVLVLKSDLGLLGGS